MPGVLTDWTAVDEGVTEVIVVVLAEALEKGGLIIGLPDEDVARVSVTEVFFMEDREGGGGSAICERCSYCREAGEAWGNA